MNKCRHCDRLCKKPQHSFCSRTCYKAWQKGRRYGRAVVYPACEHCGKTCRNTTNRFCSKQCGYAWKTGKPNPKLRIPKPSCKQCGNACRLSIHQFCSQACFRAWTRGRPRPETVKPRKTKTCPTCMTEFKTVNGRREKTYCSSTCWHIASRKNLDDPGTKFFFGADWRRRRFAILERDNHACVFCGRYANTVHHLIPRAQGGHHREDNLAAVCTICHGAVDKVMLIMVTLNPHVDLRRWLRSFMPRKARLT